MKLPDYAKKKGCYDSAVVGAFGAMTKKFEKYTESLGIEIRIGHVQKSALFGTARTIFEVLSR